MDEGGDLAGCDYTMLRLEGAFFDAVKRRHEQFQLLKSRTLRHLAFDDGIRWCQPFTWNGEGDFWRGTEDLHHWQWGGGLRGGVDEAATDADIEDVVMMVDKFGIYWRLQPCGVSFAVETHRLTWKELKQIEKGAGSGLGLP
jgi:hypothetical protein